jgi:hemolysin activation/secretion protein
LILKEIAEPARASVAFNNYGSRFTGIERTSFAYETSVLPFQNSMISGFANFPNGNNLWSLNLEHDIRVAPRFNLKVAAAKTASQPGFTLAVNEIKSTAVKFNTEIGWQALQRRSHKATFFAGLDMLNSSVDVLGSVLTRDRIRKAYIKADYNGQGFMGGHDYFSLNFSHGLKALGSNDNGDLNLSRAAAKPDFSKLEATWQHQRMLTPDLLFNSVLIGQRASKALYSSEEFGFGGEQNARAYDSAEITGDHGLGATLELHYTSLPDKYGLTLRPFAFYDIGKIWNIDNGQPDGLSIADIGAGINMSHTSGLVGKLTIAQPLSKTIDTPVYGRNGHNPRLYFQIKHNF